MPEVGDEEGHDHVERLAGNHERLKDAWERTIDEMLAMADDYEAEGWETVAIAAGHAAPEHPDAGPPGRWGIVHVIPDNYAEEFEAAFERGEFPTYDVYRTEVDGRVFYVLEVLDPETETVILLCGAFELFNATMLVNKSKAEGHVYTHVQTLDETHRGSFRHEEPAKFFPHYDEFDTYVDPEPISNADDG